MLTCILLYISNKDSSWFTNSQLSFYRPLCYNSRAHCPLLQFLCTTSAILAGAHSYFVVSSFKCEGKNSYHDLIPNTRILRTLRCMKQVSWQ